MADTLLPAIAAYIPRDRVESILRPDTPTPDDGVALIADISGFTPLTEALTHGLSPDQGAEELTRALDGVFTPLIAEIHAFRGSVIKFGGDALIVWYARAPGQRRSALIRRALTSAFRMQQAIAAHGRIPTPIGLITLKMKIGMAYGPARRFRLGLPEYGYEDVLGGRTLDRMAEAEHHAEADEIVLDAETLAPIAGSVEVAEWREGFAVAARLRRPARPNPWPPLACPSEAEQALIAALAPYVPPQIYAALASGQVQVAELKPVISLFVQFHGIDYDTDAEVDEKLQRYFATAQQVTARYGGRLNRLITGDKGSLLHIIFGAPRSVEEQEARAIRCALDLQRECGGLPFIAMQRIGVSSGRVFVGPVGSPDRHDYTTMGDSINLSARLMQNAAPGQILMEAAVRAALSDDFEVDDLGSIRVKGKAQPIPVFAALAYRPRQYRRAPQRAIFGRDAELAAIERRIAALPSGQGGIVALVGEVGMGKTMLLDLLRTRHPAGWAGGMSLAYGQPLSGYLFIELLRDLLELPPGAGPDESGRRLTELCADLFGPARLDSTFPYLARFMGLSLSGEAARRIEGLAGESLRWQIFAVFQELLRLLLERRPMVLALDDLQWAGPTSLQLLEAILPLSASHPVLLILSMRPERESRAWALREQLLAHPPGMGALSEVTLGPLDRESSQTLIAHFAPALPARLADELVQKSGGNPLFLVELMRTLQARGLLAPGLDLSRVALDTLGLPDSVQGLLLAQIDRLAVEARHTLQMASVIGRTFLYRVLEMIAAGERRLSEWLAALEADDYILRDQRAELDLAYAFRHILIQESVYSTLLYERRRAYHRAVAEALERLFPAQIAEQAGTLAFHYERADDLEHAVYYHLQAADQARLLYANDEAEALYQRVLELLDRHEAGGATPDLERRARTYLKIAQVRSNTLDFVGAQEWYDRAFELLEKLEATRPAVRRGTQNGARTMRIGVLEHGPLTLDPGLYHVEDVSEIIHDLFEGLVELDAELNVIPAIARRWSIVQDGRRYRFELRRDLKWSDGSPLTAHDFVFAWQRNLHPDTGAGLAHLLYMVEGAEAFHQGRSADPDSIAIRAHDDFTLEIDITVPAGYFLYILTVPIAYPQPARTVQQHRADWSKPEHLVCNGPFRIDDWQQGHAIHLQKNRLYRGLVHGNLEGASLYFVQPSLESYLANQIDWCRVEDRADLVEQYREEAFVIQYLYTFFLGFACGYAPFNQRLVRQAFAQSIDKRDLVKQVWSNVQTPATGGIIPPGMPGHSPEIGLSFDPRAARELLTRAGFASGAGLPSLTLAVSGGFGATPQYLQQSWHEHLGIDVQLIENMSIEEILGHLGSGAIQLALIGWLVDYPDPDDVLRVLFHGSSPINYFGWRHAGFDQLVQRAASIPDQQMRLALYHEADRLLVAEDTGVIPLYYRQAYGLLRPPFTIEGSGKIIRGGAFKLKHIVVD